MNEGSVPWQWKAAQEDVYRKVKRTHFVGNKRTLFVI